MLIILLRKQINIDDSDLPKIVEITLFSGIEKKKDFIVINEVLSWGTRIRT